VYVYVDLSLIRGSPFVISTPSTSLTQRAHTGFTSLIWGISKVKNKQRLLLGIPFSLLLMKPNLVVKLLVGR
jgi:hypothetical protein